MRVVAVVVVTAGVAAPAALPDAVLLENLEHGIVNLFPRLAFDSGEENKKLTKSALVILGEVGNPAHREPLRHC